PARRQLEARGRPIEWCYFPETGLASIIAQAGRGQQVETGIVGREGFVGLGIAHGDDRATQTTVVQIAGDGYRAPAALVQELVEQSRDFHRWMLRFTRAFMVQAAQTALANGSGRLEQRLARWLLMLHDRVDGDALSITHDYIAI